MHLDCQWQLPSAIQFQELTHTTYPQLAIETIVERTQTGKAVARLDPNFKDGRPKKYTPEQIELALSLLAQGKTYRQITTMTGISKSTLIRARK